MDHIKISPNYDIHILPEESV